MAVEDQQDSDPYVIANFARWAGDLAYSIEVLQKIVPPDRRIVRRSQRLPTYLDEYQGEVEKRLAEPRRGREPTELIEAASEEQYFRVAETLALPSPESLPNVPPPGLIDDVSVPPSNVIEGKHLRAVVQLITDHEFEMRAYLTDLTWERDFFARVNDQIKAHRGQRLESEGDARGGKWILEGLLFRIVTVDDFGLIESRATWTRRDPPDAKDVFEAFREVLRALDR